MSDIAAFVNARLDEDEAWVIDYRTKLWEVQFEAADTPQHQMATSAFVFGVDPDKMLADVRAKRRIVDEYEAAQAIDTPGGTTMRDLAFASAMGRRTALGKAVHALAAVWSDHPDYRAEWAL